MTGVLPPGKICGGRTARTWPDSAAAVHLPKNEPEIEELAAKKTQPASRDAGQASKVWNFSRF
jgi:hypothetical protein